MAIDYVKSPKLDCFEYYKIYDKLVMSNRSSQAKASGKAQKKSVVVAPSKHSENIDNKLNDDKKSSKNDKTPYQGGAPTKANNKNREVPERFRQGNQSTEPELQQALENKNRYQQQQQQQQVYQSPKAFELIPPQTH